MGLGGRTLTESRAGVCAGEQPLITPTLWRNIVGQSLFQLGLMYALVVHGNTIFDVPSHLDLAGAPSEHYTIVFNTFVLMQLFNQVAAQAPLGTGA